MFFFSSRRRHTRYIGDWSSDVCSSDLGDAVAAAPDAGAGDAVAHYPASDGVTSTQILTLVRGARSSLGEVAEMLSAEIGRASCRERGCVSPLGSATC